MTLLYQDTEIKIKCQKKPKHFQKVIMKQSWIPDESHHVMNTEMRLEQIISVYYYALVVMCLIN